MEINENTNIQYCIDNSTFDSCSQLFRYYKHNPDGTRVRTDGRTRCIFENGTESNMMKRSVEKVLYAMAMPLQKKMKQAFSNLTKTFLE